MSVHDYVLSDVNDSQLHDALVAAGNFGILKRKGENPTARGCSQYRVGGAPADTYRLIYNPSLDAGDTATVDAIVNAHVPVADPVTPINIVGMGPVANRPAGPDSAIGDMYLVDDPPILRWHAFIAAGWTVVNQ